MISDENFIEDLLADAEAKEELQTEAYFDLLLLQIEQLQEQISANFSEAEKEIQIIKDWALRRNHGIQLKIEWMEKKLEGFIRERKQKTIDLPHGVLKYHKKPDKVEIANLDLFLEHALPEMLTVVPETVKPDLSKIKAFVKTHASLPQGVKFQEGKEEFSYKLHNRKEVENGRQEETGAAAEPALHDRIAV